MPRREPLGQDCNRKLNVCDWLMRLERAIRHRAGGYLHASCRSHLEAVQPGAARVDCNRTLERSGSLYRRVVEHRDYRLENDPRFLARLEETGEGLRAGRRVTLEDL